MHLGKCCCHHYADAAAPKTCSFTEKKQTNKSGTTPYPNGASASAPRAGGNGSGQRPATRDTGGSARADREQRTRPEANTHEPAGTTSSAKEAPTKRTKAAIKHARVGLDMLITVSTTQAGCFIESCSMVQGGMGESGAGPIETMLRVHRRASASASRGWQKSEPRSLHHERDVYCEHLCHRFVACPMEKLHMRRGNLNCAAPKHCAVLMLSCTWPLHAALHVSAAAQCS
jgi:hypothetical protein